MFSQFFLGIQQDLKLFLFAPLLCAIFRAFFIWKFWPFQSFAGRGRQLWHCFRYGFWWGMDFNAYVFLWSMLLVSLPGAFLLGYFAAGNWVREAGLLVYLTVLYAAFIGRIIFYEHYQDIYNHLLWLGKNAEKHNLLDVFFSEHHGMWLLLSFLPFWLVSALVTECLLGLPSITLPVLAGGYLQYGLNGLIFLGAIAFFYYCRFGGTFLHANKPEWDEIPSIVKRDIFLARATVDDLPALEMVWRHPLNSLLTHTDAEDVPVLDAVMPEPYRENQWQALSSPVAAFVHTAKGPHIRAPKHIFLIVGESYAQHPLDDIYASLHLADCGRRFQRDPHTAVLSNFLPAGMLSRPSIVSLMTGIFDARLELNEQEAFWHGTVASSLPLQLKKLGYRSIYWYGGNSTYGNFNQYAPAVGFDQVMAAVDFCPPDSPRTWVGVYDDIFLTHAAERIEAMDTDTPIFHFVYTTSNHGPYKMDLAKQGYDTEKVMPEAPEAVRHSHERQQVMGTYWYSDRAVFAFVDRMLAAYPDSLVIVTGDHSAGPIPMDMGIIARTETTLREHFCTSFAMHQREIDQRIFVGNTIGGHMNIAPTIFELIAPAGFRYYSLFESLTEPIRRVVTPYHWMTCDAVGSADDALYQGLAVSAQPVETYHETDGQSRFAAETAGYSAITGWIARHPELLRLQDTFH